MITTTHITTLLTIGVLISAGLALLTEWVATRNRWAPARAKSIRKWLPIVLGLLIGSTCFGLAYSQVVGPIEIDVRWVGLGAFAGLCAGAGSKVAYETAKSIVDKVKG